MGKNVSISASEREIMNVVWQSGKSMCVNDIFKTLGNSEWKYTTVATFLTRKYKKGFLVCEKRGNQNFYSAVLSEEEYMSEQTAEFVKEVYGGRSTEFIAALAKDKISDADYAELIDILKKYEDQQL